MKAWQYIVRSPDPSYTSTLVGLCHLGHQWMTLFQHQQHGSLGRTDAIQIHLGLRPYNLVDMICTANTASRVSFPRFPCWLLRAGWDVYQHCLMLSLHLWQSWVENNDPASVPTHKVFVCEEWWSYCSLPTSTFVPEQRCSLTAEWTL